MPNVNKVTHMGQVRTIEEDRALRRGLNVTLGKLMHRETVTGQEMGGTPWRSY